MTTKVKLDKPLTGVIAPIKGVEPELELALRLAALDNGIGGQKEFIKKVLRESEALKPYLKKAKKMI